MTKNAPATIPPERAVHEPADVGRELLRLGTGQQHAVVERVQEALLADPAAPVDELAVHDRDLAGRSAEGDEPELHPEAKGLGEWHHCLLHRSARPAGGWTVFGDDCSIHVLASHVLHTRSAR